MSTIAQIKKIHVLKNDLHLEDERYRSLLAAYHRQGDASVESSKELSVPQASAVIQRMEHIIDESPEIHFRIYASERQIKMLFGMWRTVTGIADATGVRKTFLVFLEHHFHVHDFDHIPKSKVSKIMYTLSIMIQQKAQKR